MAKALRKGIDPFDHDALGLSPEDTAKVIKCEQEILKLERRTTEGTFLLGKQLGIGAELIPERTFGKWAAAVSGYSREHAYTFIKIAKVLHDHRERLIDARVRDNVLRKLSKSPGHVPKVLEILESGERLTAKQVTAMVDGEKEAFSRDLPNMGGIAGLRANALAKTKQGLADFARNIAAMIDSIEEALEPATQGKRVLKGALVDKIEHPARLAKFQLQNLALFVDLNPLNAAVSQVIPFPEGSKWHKTDRLLWVLGGRDSWPRGDPGTWLSGELLPLLTWAAGTPEDKMGPDDRSL